MVCLPLWITPPIQNRTVSLAIPVYNTSPYTIFLLLPLIFAPSPPSPCPPPPPPRFSLLSSVSISLSLSSTQKALLHFLVTLIDCINLSAYWISPAPCREHGAICL